MRVVRPHTPGTLGQTLTAALKALRPTRADLVDAGLLFALGMVAVAGFTTTFEGVWVLAVGALGLAVGIVLAHLGTGLRVHWLLAVAAAVATYFLIGPALATRDDALGGTLPTIAAWRRLLGLAVGGWKELLTTLPPVEEFSPYLALPLILTLLTGVLGFGLARRLRQSWPAVIAPGVLLLLSLGLGTLRPAALLLQGLGFAVLALIWVMLRQRRRQQLVGTGRTHGVQIALGAGVLALAMLGGALAGPALISASPRQVIRSYVHPPLELTQYPTPLAGFRTFSSKTLNLNYDRPLLQTAGLAPGSRLRLAVLDAYTGAAWSAAGADGGDAGFQRLGAQVPNPPLQDLRQVSIDILDGYAADTNLNVWLPSLGRAATVDFAGPGAREHAASFAYKLDTDQGLIPDRFRAGDQILITGSALGNFDVEADELDPGSSSVLSDGATTFLVPTAQAYGGTTNVPLDRLKGIAAELRSGAWSDGTKPNEQQFMPGHGIYRLTRMVKAPQLVGSDEQYASLFALLANITGYPSRVVFGAVVPDGGQIKGKDIHAWVELQTADGAWRTVPESVFTPDRTKTPKHTTDTPDRQKAPTNVPPPNPVRPPATTDEMSDTQPSAARIEPNAENAWLQVLLQVLLWGGPPVAVLGAIVGAILAAKALRRSRRRTRGAPSTRIASGWQEVLDQARDLGRVLPGNQTRLEQGRALGGGRLGDLAREANRSVFGQGDITDDQVDTYWRQVETARATMLGGAGFWQALRGRLSVASLLTRRTSVRRARGRG